MSSNHFLYFGPYVVCKIESRFRKIKGCTNSNCHDYKIEIDSAWNYCPFCSQSISEITIDDSLIIVQDDIISNMKNRLVKPLNSVANVKYIKYIEETRSHIYLPNPDSSVPHIFYDSSENENIQFIPEFDFYNISNIVREFKSFYILSFQNLFEAYGKKNVKVHFGLLTQIMD